MAAYDHTIQYVLALYDNYRRMSRTRGIDEVSKFVQAHELPIVQFLSAAKKAAKYPLTVFQSPNLYMKISPSSVACSDSHRFVTLSHVLSLAF